MLPISRTHRPACSQGGPFCITARLRTRLSGRFLPGHEYRRRGAIATAEQCHCEELRKAHGLNITDRHHDGASNRASFDQMTGEATGDTPPFDFIIIHALRNYPWPLKETVLCRDSLGASGVSLVSTAKSWP